VWTKGSELENRSAEGALQRGAEPEQWLEDLGLHPAAYLQTCASEGFGFFFSPLLISMW